MAYTKTTWVNGETPINADNLNHIETGIKNNDTSIGNITGTILWTNANPETSLTGANITLSSSDYDVYEVYYYDWITGKHMKSEKALKGQNTMLDMLLYFEDSAFIGVREITYVSDTSLSIGRCNALVDRDAFSHITPANWCVPIYIVGYKTGLFGGQS